MTLLGRMVSQSGTANQVNAYDVWTVVATMDRSLLTNTTREYAFWISGLVGNFGISTQSANTVVELAVGEVNSAGVVVAVSGRDVHRLQIADSRLWGLQVDRGAVPFQFLVVLASTAGLSAHPTWGTQWPADRSLALVARLRANGDPPGGNGQFFVSDYVIVAWNLEALGTTKWRASDYRPAQPQQVNPPPTPRFFTLGTQSHGVVGDEWLVFYSCNYRPQRASAFNSAPVIEPLSTPDGTQGSATIRDRVGLDARLSGANSGQFVDYHHGGFFVLAPTSTATTVGLRGRDNYTAGTGGAPSLQTMVVGATFFAVKGKDASTGNTLYNWSHDTQVSVTPGTGPVGSATGLVAFGVNVPSPTGFVVMRKSSVVATSAPPDRQYVHGGFGENFAPIYWLGWAAEQVLTPQERVPCIQMFDIGGVGVGATGSRSFAFVHYHGLHGPFYALPEQSIANHVAVGFFFENNPGNLLLPPVTPGAHAVIVPGRESLDASALPVLPRHPDADYRESEEGGESRFLSDLGYTWRRPLFTGTRRIFALTFSNLTATERDALLEFFAANRAIGWAPRGESSKIAFIVASQPQSSPMAGTLYSISVGLLELIWTGP